MTPVSTPSARGAGAATIALGVLMAMAGRASLASPEVLRSMVEPSFKTLACAAVSWLILVAFWAALWMTASKLSGGTRQQLRHVRIEGAALLVLATAALMVPYGAAALGLPKITFSPKEVRIAFLTGASVLHLRALPPAGMRLAMAALAGLGTGLGIAALRWSDGATLPTPAIAEVLPVGIQPARSERLDRAMSVIDALREQTDRARATPRSGSSDAR